MKYYTEGHDLFYDTQTMIQVFFPNEKYEKINNLNDTEEFVASIYKDDFFYSYFYKDGKIISSYKLKEKNIKIGVKKSLYFLLSDLTNSKIPWGILTGIRPTKIVGQLLETKLNYSEINTKLQNDYLLQEEKSKLCIEVYKKQLEIIKNNNGNDLSLYIGIPFCPSRCIYCSFTSYSIEKYNNQIENYINSLEKEMIFIKNYLNDTNKFLETIYIGGGTPTSLDEYNLEKLLFNVNKYFDIKNLKEFTVEAGRPDTINLEKIKILKKYNVSRISINPQTMENKTLKIIKRNHTVEDFLNSYYLARQEGFGNINVDIILGLPNENESNVENTMLQLEKLKPENITAHTLAIKRSSKLHEEIFSNNYNLGNVKQMENFIDIVKDYTNNLKMNPYYLYRQKNMLGNFENVGYSLENYECIYNVQVIEEKQTNFAIGAGGISKIIDLELNKIDRIFNVKNLEEYLFRIDEMINRKRNFLFK